MTLELEPVTIGPVRVGVVLIAVLTLVGCGGSKTRVRAFELAVPHGITRADEQIDAPGNARAVYLGPVRLDVDRWTCLGSQWAARYQRTSGGVLVSLDDASTICAGPPRVRLVGGYARQGGYVGEWIPGAVLSD